MDLRVPMDSKDPMDSTHGFYGFEGFLGLKHPMDLETRMNVKDCCIPIGFMGSWYSTDFMDSMYFRDSTG